MRWLIGDIHGMLRPLETLLREIDRADSEASIYFTGDYVNRGRESKGVIDLLLTLKNATFIRGNHDDVLDHILHGVSYAETPSGIDRFMSFQWFLEHGLLETLQSYGVTPDQISRVITRRSRDSMQAISDLFPLEHRKFIRSLPVFIDDEDLFVVHGKWPPREFRSPRELLEGSFPDPPLRQLILWGRFTPAELKQRKAWPKTGFFGHTPIPSYEEFKNNCAPLIGPQMVLLDTAAALGPTGRLTAMCAESSQIIQSDPTGKLIDPPATALIV